MSRTGSAQPAAKTSCESSPCCRPFRSRPYLECSNINGGGWCIGDRSTPDAILFVRRQPHSRYSMQSDHDEKGAAVKFHPGLVFILCMLAAYGADELMHISIRNSLELERVGSAVAALGICIILFSQYSLKRAGTNIGPTRPTTKIVSTGIYAYSRNPIYAALCLILIGVGIRENSVIIAASIIPLVVMLYWAVIQKEEAYLENKFGEEYLQYKNKVRRWV